MWHPLATHDRPLQSSPTFRRPRRINSVPPQSRAVIESCVIQIFGVGPGDIGAVTRGRARVAEARQVAMYLGHVSLGFTMRDVGKLFARDRTTVAHACSVIEDRRDDPAFDRILEFLEWSVIALVRPLHSTIPASLRT